MRSNQRLTIFLVDAVIPLVKYLNSIMIVVSLIDGYMLTSYINAIVKFSLFTSIFKFFLQVRCLDNGKVSVIHLFPIHNLSYFKVSTFGELSGRIFRGYNQPDWILPFLVGFLWYYINSFGDGITCVAINCLTDCSS